ncbi:MAG: class I SAM-dependent methyltransferase [Armatimonadota bacterium]
MIPIEHTTHQLYTLFSQALASKDEKRYHEELWRSYGHVATPSGARRRVQFVYDLCRLVRFDPQDKVILDAGCGYGVIAIIFSLMGARKVWGLDISEERLTTFQRMIQDYHLAERLDAQRRSVEDTGLGDGSVDAVISNEAISHYYDVDAFLREAARVLKPGGVLLIADGNNAANPLRRRDTEEIWNRFENGPPGEVHGHKLETPYVEMRRQIIRSTAPNLSAEIVDRLALETAYMKREQVVHAVEEYLTTGKFPNSRFDRRRCPVNPESGAYMERMFHPAQFAREIEQYGFRARYYAALGGAIPTWLSVPGRLFTALTPLTLPIARAFRIVAVRE